MNEQIDIGTVNNCKNLSESYGEICVKCNACGRFGKETMWEARYNMYWWEIADILDNHSENFYRSKLQQENIAKNLIFYGERLLECAQNMDFDQVLQDNGARFFDIFNEKKDGVK